MNKETVIKAELSCLQKSVQRWKWQQQMNALKSFSDTVAVSPKKELSQL